MSVEKKNAYIGVDLGGTNMRAYAHNWSHRFP